MSDVIELPARELTRILKTDSRFKVATMLMEVGHVNFDQVVESISWVRQGQGLSCTYLLKKHYIDEDTVPQVLVRNYGYKRFVPGDMPVDSSATALLAYEEAKKHLALPFRTYRDHLILAMVEPANEEACRKISRATAMPVKSLVVGERELVECFQQHYQINATEYRSFFRPLTNEPAISSPAWESAENVNMGELISGALEDYIASPRGRRGRPKGAKGVVDNLKKWFSR